MANRRSRKAVIGIGALLPCVVTLPTLAQNLEEVVVTATRREERLQDVPIAVSVVTGESVREQGFSDIESVAEFTPNLIIQDGFQGQTLLVRGIGTDTRNEAFEQAVAQFADGVYYGRDNMSLSGLFDLERIEVVRGPQPVFAGQSATAGAINTISRKPGDHLEGNTTVEYGDDGERSFEGAIGGPLTDTFGMRVAGRYYDLPDAGYEQIVTGSEIGAQKIKAARLTAVWKPTDTFDANFKYEYQNVFQNGTPAEYGRCDTDLATSSAGPLGVGLPALCALEGLTGIADLNTYNRVADSGGTLDVRDAVDYVNANLGGHIVTPIPRGLNLVDEYNHPEDRQLNANIVVGQFNWSLGRLTLSGISGLVTFNKSDWLDPDESAYAVFTDHRFEDFRQYSQEIRLASPLDQKISWMVGVYWQTHTSDLGINVHFPFNPTPAPGIAFSPGGRLHEESDWASAFFTATWNVTDTVRFNVGARYQDSRKEGTYVVSSAFLAAGATRFGPRTDSPAPPMTASVDSSDTLPEVGLQWKPVENAMFYGKYAEAFKAGGFVMNPPLPDPPNPFTFLPEQAKGWEVGYKGTLFHENLQLNVAYFDTKFDDLQVNSFNGTTARFEVRNAAAARTRGVEIDGRYAYGNHFTLGFNAGTNDAKYTSFPNGQCGQIQARDWVAAGNVGPCVVDISGRSLGTPEWQFGLAPQVTFPLGQYAGSAGLNMTWFDGTVSPANPGDALARIEARHRIDLRVALMPPSDKWELALYARDLTDEQAHIGGLQSGFFSTTRGTSDSDVHLYGVGGKRFERGRRVGLQASYFLGRP